MTLAQAVGTLPLTPSGYTQIHLYHLTKSLNVIINSQILFRNHGMQKFLKNVWGGGCFHISLEYQKEICDFIENNKNLHRNLDQAVITFKCHIQSEQPVIKPTDRQLDKRKRLQCLHSLKKNTHLSYLEERVCLALNCVQNSLIQIFPLEFLINNRQILKRKLARSTKMYFTQTFFLQ